MLSGETTKGLVGTAVEANRLLKFAKENSDVGLCFSPPVPLDQLRMITAFDASFCSRSDGSSQGGYFVMLANNQVLGPGEAVCQQKHKLLVVQAMRQSLPAATLSTCETLI